jgi:hypothetical protein
LARLQGKLAVESLTYQGPTGFDEPISIRFRPSQWRSVQAVAKREKDVLLREPSAWVRAVVLERTREVLGGEAA